METQFIEWGNRKNVIAQYKSIEDFMTEDWMNRQANNFGHLHLVDSTIKSWSKYKVNNIFVVEANPVYNYGLDFECYIHYTTSEGMNFMMKMSTGGSSLTSGPLVRVSLNVKMPMELFRDEDWGKLPNAKELLDELLHNMANNIIESFEYSTNVGYRKDKEVRHLLVEMCREHNFIFA